jgi:peptidoglycan/xylan/chitin deacetylase (PgdA/CDA1 family)
MAKKALIAYCVDFDCCSPWLSTGDGSKVDATTLSRGLFGANAGLDRLLKFFEKNGIKGTFNIPSHTIESFPDGARRVLEAGHEM